MSQLNENTTNLQNILNTINSLPNKTNGDTIETCTVKFNSFITSPKVDLVIYTTVDESMKLKNVTSTSIPAEGFICACNTTFSFVTLNAINGYNIDIQSSSSSGSLPGKELYSYNYGCTIDLSFSANEIITINITTSGGSN